MIFVDSSVWIDWLREIATSHTEALDRLIADQEVIVGDLVLAEVLQGTRHERNFERTRRVLLGLHTVQVSNIEIALQAAAHHRYLRSLGITLRGTIDTLIATRCIHEGWPLLASDRDFRPFADHLGLTLPN